MKKKNAYMTKKRSKLLLIQLRRYYLHGYIHVQNTDSIEPSTKHDLSHCAMVFSGLIVLFCSAPKLTTPLPHVHVCVTWSVPQFLVIIVLGCSIPMYSVSRPMSYPIKMIFKCNHTHL